METSQIIADAECDFKCQFEWIEVSSNFFNVSVYTPALLVGIAGYVIYRIIKKVKGNVL
jgi:uncharacterized membrane protein